VENRARCLRFSCFGEETSCGESDLGSAENHVSLGPCSSFDLVSHNFHKQLTDRRLEERPDEWKRRRKPRSTRLAARLIY